MAKLASRGALDIRCGIPDLLAALSERCLLVPGKGNRAQFTQEPAQVPNGCPVQVPVLIPELEHLVQGDRTQIETHRFQVQLDEPAVGRHPLSRERRGEIRNGLSMTRHRVETQISFGSRGAQELAQKDQDRRSHLRMEGDRNAVFARSREISCLQFLDKRIGKLHVGAVPDP